MKILSIRNSFSQNAHAFLPEIAANAGCDLTLFDACLGGCTLERRMHHANDTGCYLIACAWLETLLGRDARTLTYKPETVVEKDAVLLREFAYQAAGAVK